MSLFVDVAIIGAGWAGIWALYSLRKAGFTAVIIEAKGEVGGVWNYVKYPGCGNVWEDLCM